ncbi:MAG: tetratricopeptide repeat-containing protein [Chloroflexaceae bacterium]|nr:tetratricopeptide repeat-containing protein [Chloroflexaceae bacterium]
MGVARHSWNLGLLYEAQGDLQRAAWGNARTKAALGNLGSAYHSLGDYPRAIAYHEQHLAISRAIGVHTRCTSLRRGVTLFVP